MGGDRGREGEAGPVARVGSGARSALEDGDAEATTTRTTIPTTVGSASASVGSARSRFMGDDEMRASLAGVFDLPDVALDALESRDVLVVRSKQSPRRFLLLVRLTLPSGEPVVSHSPSRAEPDSRLGSLSRRSLFSARGTEPRVPRRSEGSISFTVHRGAQGGDDSEMSEVRSRRSSRTLESPEINSGSVSGRESQGEVTASLDALDVMSLSNKLLAGFARGRVETRRSQRQAYFAWRAHVREAKRLRSRAEMVGSLYEKKWRQRLVTAWERRASELRAKRRNQERMCLRVRQWRARWRWRRCTLGFVRWRRLARTSAAGVELLERWARRWLNSAAARCVARWRAHVADVARMRTAARRVVRRMRTVKLSAAFDRWLDRAKESNSARAKIRAAMMAASKTTTRGAFRRWARVADVARRGALDARRAEVLFERRRRAFKADAFSRGRVTRRISGYRRTGSTRSGRGGAGWSARLPSARGANRCVACARFERTCAAPTWRTSSTCGAAPRGGDSRGGGCGRRRRAEPGSTPRPYSSRSADFSRRRSIACIGSPSPPRLPRGATRFARRA